MDPRPYHYEYRRPRWSNPTYQSVNLYQSLYHKGLLNRYQNASKLHQFKPNSQFQRQIYEQSILKKTKKDQNNTLNKKGSFSNNKSAIDSTPRRLSNSVVLDNNNNPETSRPYSNRSNQLNDWNVKQRPSILASYGKNTMAEQRYEDKQSKQKIPNYDHLNRFTIYQKQQKPYNIIGNYPRSTSTQLKQFPKLTLQDKLIEQGRFKPLF